MGQPLRLEGSMAGWQELFFNNQLVSQVPAAAPKDEGENCSELTVHEFDVHLLGDRPGQTHKCRVLTQIQWLPFEVSYQWFIDGLLVEDGKHRDKTIEKQIYPQMSLAQKSLKVLSSLALFLKLFKSAKVIQLFLAGASLAIYSWFFTLSFAFILLAVLLVHEVGHMRALQYFGARNKGMYLIPFVGGLADHESLVSNRWQAAMVILAGPAAGLAMSLLFMLLYGMTGDVLFGAIAAFNALLNLFNLLPVLPLDGGQLLKQVSFSMTRAHSILTGLALALIGSGVCFWLNLPLLAVLILIGCTEIAVAWQHRAKKRLTSLESTAQWFVSICYLLLVMSFIGVIWFFAGMGDDVLGLPLKILYS